MPRVRRFALCLLLLYVGTATTARVGYLYVLLNDAAGNRIYGFSVNETTGATALLAGFPVNTGGTGGTLAPNNHLTIDQKNNRLYAINDGTDRVSAYSIDPATGALTALPFSPIALGSASWIQIAVHPSGSPLVIGNFQGSAYSYTITATTAIPPPSPTSLTAVIPSSSVFSHDGNFFYTGGSGNVVGFSVNPTTGIFTPLD
jgi:6-phosphogluconolactonase (cycloisomerase 2 family)